MVFARIKLGALADHFQEEMSGCGYAHRLERPRKHMPTYLQLDWASITHSFRISSFGSGENFSVREPQSRSGPQSPILHPSRIRLMRAGRDTPPGTVRRGHV